MPPKRRKKERLSKDAKIAIVGGGLGGLGAALSLQQEGYDNVTVYERDASLDEAREGFGLTLTYNPKGPLAKMGVLEQVAQQDCPSRSHYVFSSDGTVLGYYGNAFMKNRGNGQRGNLRVPRRVLRRILLENTTCKIQGGKRLEGFDCSETGKVALNFQDGTTVGDIDLLVGADGIRSQVVKTLWTRNKQDDYFGLRYMGVMIILGIADFCHPLLDERGFYTLDGTHRLFTMPYAGSRLDDEQEHRSSSGTSTCRRRIMWQLSYRLADETEARRLREAEPQTLLDEVLRRCQMWHEPVKDLFMATPLETIWGTWLMDREPAELLECLDPRKSARVVILGDAAHSMSPFKGQGANQSLLDGPLLTSWLGRASVGSALRGFMRDMVARTSPKVKASREAAELLHSPLCFDKDRDFAGVLKEEIPLFLDTLRKREIGAHKGRLLDESVLYVMKELGVDTEMDSDPTSSCLFSDKDVHSLHGLALSLSKRGDTNGLRNLSLKHVDAIQNARDDQGRTCLHIVSQGGHYHCCRWLLSEVLVSHRDLTSQKEEAREAAVANGDAEMVSLLSSGPT